MYQAKTEPTTPKRTWHYAMRPRLFDIKCNRCGEHVNTTWSEYEKHIWCFKCQDDIPITHSILNGPIPVATVELLGLSFDRIMLPSGQLEIYNSKTNEYERS